MATAAVTAAGAVTASDPEQVRAEGRPGGGAASARVAELFEAHARLVLGICRGMLRDPADAEDAAQQVFLSAFGSLLAGRAPRDEEAWIATIARNECRTRIRSRMREPLAELDGETLQARDDAFEASVRRADVRALRRVLAELPAQQREAFLLREFSGLSYDELARTLSVSLASVESLLFRARQTLRARLEPAFATLNGVVAFPLGLIRILAAGGGESAGGAAKLAAAGVGAVLVAGGTVGLEQHVAHSDPARQAKPPAVARHVRRHAHSPTRASATPVVASAKPAPVVAAAVTHVVSRSGRGSGGTGHSSSQGSGSSPGGSAAATEQRRSGGGGSSDDGPTIAPPTSPPPTTDTGDDSSPPTVAQPTDDGSGSGSGDGSSGSGDSGSGSDGSGSGSGSSDGSGSGDTSGPGSGDSSSPSGSGSGDGSHDGGGSGSTSDPASGSGSGSGDGGSSDSHSD